MTSIRARLVGRLLLIFAALFGAADVLIYVTIDHILDANLDNSLLAKAKARSSLVAQDSTGIDIDWRGLADQFNQRGGIPDLVQVQDEHHHSLGGDQGTMIEPPPLKNNVAHWKFKLPNGNSYRAVALRFQPHLDEDQLNQIGNKVVPSCVLVVATDRSELNQTQLQLAMVLAGATAVALVASSGFIFWGVSQGLVILHDFGTTVSKIDETSLDQRLNTDDLPSEVQPIAEKLNDLLGRMEVSFARERRFSADVSHELRTPIAELRSVAEIMLKQPNLSSETQQAFRDVLGASYQMEAVVATLLEIVREERNISTLEIRKIDVGELLRVSWKTYEDKAQAKDLKLSFHLPDSIWLETDQRLLRMVINNLFSNAVEYTPAGGMIEIDIHDTEGRSTISIQNSTEDISPKDLPHFFERFWRKDKVRGNSEHIGLGLSLTQLLCQRLQIHLTSSMPTPNLVCFWLAVPIPHEHR
jgi:two-component system sensor histidine kinase QseC